MGTSQISFAKILYKRPTRQKPRTCVARSEVRVWHGPKTCRNRNSMNCCIFIGSRAWHVMLATNGNNWESHCIYTIFNVIRLCQLTILIGCASPFIACSHFLMSWNFISWFWRFSNLRKWCQNIGVTRRIIDFGGFQTSYDDCGISILHCE